MRRMTKKTLRAVIPCFLKPRFRILGLLDSELPANLSPSEVVEPWGDEYQLGQKHKSGHQKHLAGYKIPLPTDIHYHQSRKLWFNFDSSEHWSCENGANRVEDLKYCRDDQDPFECPGSVGESGSDNKDKQGVDHKGQASGDEVVVEVHLGDEWSEFEWWADLGRGAGAVVG